MVKLELKSFTVCLFIGVTSGLIYAILDLIFLFANGKNSQEKATKIQNYTEFIKGESVTSGIKRVIFFVLSAFYFKLVTFYYELSNQRLYMAVAFILGFICYLKSFHNKVAIFNKWVYNIITKIINVTITAIKNSVVKIKGRINERRKKAQGSVGGCVGRNIITSNSTCNTRIPNRRHLHAKQQNKRSRRRNSKP